MKNILILTVTLLLGNVLSGQQGEKVHWYSIGEIDKLRAENPKPIFIDSYTDWCGWCKKLDQDTFSDPVIARYLNENYYPVKFNAEGKEPVTFLGREFINDGKYGKAHQLAVALMQGQLSYPTVIFMTDRGELLAPFMGYKVPKELEPLLVYFHEKKYLTQKLDDFKAEFKGSF